MEVRSLMKSLSILTVPPGGMVSATLRVVGTLSPSQEARNLFIRSLVFHNVCPGGDHPDENFSARSGVAGGVPPARPARARWPPRVAILSTGFFWDTEALASLVGEPADLIGSDFDPIATVAQHPVLLILSGTARAGLSPLAEGSRRGSFRATQITITTLSADSTSVESLVISSFGHFLIWSLVISSFGHWSFLHSVIGHFFIWSFDLYLDFGQTLELRGLHLRDFRISGIL
ncbi:MAG: hypothetical protein N3B68_02495 [Anaerolineae bacterium]|nr:hypothetical protein [Anaerolineae bacterium]